MTMNLLAPLALAALALPTASQQVATTFGPEQAPLGCNVYYSLQNAGPNSTTYDPCGFSVYDSNGALIYMPPCAGSVVIPPGQAHNSVWPQVDMNGAQVAPGVYHLQAPNGPAITVGGAEAAVAPLGTRNFELCAPQDAGRPYLMGAALSSPLPMSFMACGLTVPMSIQGFSRTLNDTAVFQGFVGFLDANGNASASIAPPPSFNQTAEIDYVFVVFDFTQSCSIRRVSALTRTLFL